MSLSTSVHATPFSVLTRNVQLRDPPDRNHLWKWIGINPDRIRIGRMRIQCGRAQTGFDPVQCALGAQCGRVLILLFFSSCPMFCSCHFFQEVSLYLAKNPAYWMLLIAGSVRNIPGYALGAWLPTFYSQVFGLPSSEYGIKAGLAVVFGGAIGSFLGGFCSDR